MINLQRLNICKPQHGIHWLSGRIRECFGFPGKEESMILEYQKFSFTQFENKEILVQNYKV